MSARRKSGFTLIELLVVIAIIAILAAILFPVFARAREAARKSNCANNMKECAISLQTYWTDYNATLPSSAVTYMAISTSGTPSWNDDNFVTFATTLGAVPVPSNQSPRTWVQMLYGHMKSRDIMFCPSDSTDHFSETSKVSYQWKFAIDRAWWGPVGTDGGRCMKESDFGYNDSQIVFYERAGFHDNKSQGLCNNIKINIAYLDSHVRNATLVNCSPEGTMIDTGVDDPTLSTWTGEPWYFNYNQEAEKAINVNPPDPDTRPTYMDPRQYSDDLP